MVRLLTTCLLAAVASTTAGSVGPAYAIDTLEIQSVAADPNSAGVTVPVLFTNDEAMEGYSLAISYDTEHIDCVDVVEVAGYSPEFFTFSVDDEAGTIILGAIVSLSPSSESDLEIPASSTPVEMVHLVFDVPPQARPGVDLALTFTNGIGHPAVNNLFSVNGQDRLVAELTDGTFTINNPNEFKFSPVSVGPGTPFAANLRCTHPEDLEAYSVEIAYDPDMLILENIDTGATELLLSTQTPSSSNIEYLDETIDNTTGSASVLMIFDYVGPFNVDKVVPSGTNQKLLEFEFLQDSSNTQGDTTTVEFVQGEVGNLIVYLAGLMAVTPVTENLELEFVSSGSVRFIRGRVNSDSSVNLADAIFLLSFLFQNGADPYCEKAADVNNNGQLNIADAVYFLTYLFNDGPNPAAPFPGCGYDPTNDSLGCGTPPASCD